MTTHSDCLFCKIASGVIPVTRIYEDDRLLAFPDINPQAPVHILIIPKRHFNSIAHVTREESELLGHLTGAASEIAQQQGIGLHDGGGGFRLVINTGPDGGQTVDHLHVHLLGGRHMSWPPG
ncbi:MAG: histidine triad nucleotide-binding protein [Acidobacteriaceae bacterium]